ncbi:hypothetical protein Ddye_005478 [Dipteronia dyeriana]|uniref:BED-type domain-containing protein n=1 Tax=Dipteronia dyeriana TaxID=168575 RepID=A0AAE0CPP3_9ROSI|nr:hypothetical protein Ddye_005478 [Dipteronia dyeriana]
MTSVEERSQINTSTDSGNNEIRVVEPSSVSGGSKRKHETSFIWSHMERVDVDGVRKAKCNFCEKLLVASQGTGTFSLKDTWKNVLANIYNTDHFIEHEQTSTKACVMYKDVFVHAQ